MNNPYYPGIGPLMSYRYDMLRAAPRPSELGPASTSLGHMWWHQSRLVLAHVLWGLYKFERTGFPGRWCTVEGGILTFPIYDFCGGTIASSAYTSVFPDASSPYPEHSYRTYYPPQVPTVTPSADFAATRSPDFVGGRITVIPDIAAFTGKSTHSLEEAEEFMTNSLGAALITLQMQQRKRGLWAADHLDIRRGRTRKILAAMNGQRPYYTSLPGVVYWKGTVEGRSDPPLADNRLRCAEAGIAFVTGNYTVGARYENENSGNTVSMAQVLLSTSVSHERFRVPETEAPKFNNPAYVELCPQALFHN